MTNKPQALDQQTRLDEFDKAEWFDVMKRVRPGLSHPEFDELWVKFQGDKRKRAIQ